MKKDENNKTKKTEKDSTVLCTHPITSEGDRNYDDDEPCLTAVNSDN